MNASHGLLTLIWLVLANLPWCGQRLLWVLPTKPPKALRWCVLELPLYYALALAVSWAVEYHQEGHISPQDWEFYVISVCLFLSMGFPCFVYKVLR